MNNKLKSILELILVSFGVFIITYLCFFIITSIVVCVSHLDFDKTIQTLNAVYVAISLIIAVIVNYRHGLELDIYKKIAFPTPSYEEEVKSN
jgi:hypothetical protein